MKDIISNVMFWDPRHPSGIQFEDGELKAIFSNVRYKKWDKVIMSMNETLQQHDSFRYAWTPSFSHKDSMSVA